MNNTEKTATIAMGTATTKNSFWTKATAFLKSCWRSLNDPAEIRKRCERSNEGRILDNTGFIIGFAIICIVCVICSQIPAYHDERALIGATFIAFFGSLIWLVNYRKAIAFGETERKAFLKKTKDAINSIFKKVCRAITNLLKLALGIVAIAILVQCIPVIGEQVPALNQFSELIVTNFNNLLNKAIAFFA